VASTKGLLPYCITDKCFFVDVVCVCVSMSGLRRVPSVTRMQQSGNEVSSHIC
jgi:hypothetical protein